MRKFAIIAMVTAMLFAVSACAGIMALAEKSLYDVILDDIYTFYGADNGVFWMDFGVQPEGKMSEEYFAEVRENGMFEAVEKYLKKATEGVRVLHMNKTDASFNETERYVAAYGTMLGGEMGDISVAVYELNEDQVYIKYHASYIDGENIEKNVVYDIVK
ncbi:MAG: hypothetical protein IJM96_02140 [Clostridia bacterium]|nr:hypothetical protein [Clostridia bacterium]